MIDFEAKNDTYHLTVRLLGTRPIVEIYEKKDTVDASKILTVDKCQHCGDLQIFQSPKIKNGNLCVKCPSCKKEQKYAGLWVLCPDCKLMIDPADADIFEDDSGQRYFICPVCGENWDMEW